MALDLPLFPDEAYFWEWSRFPSLGYLDHPPMVAWVIGLFTWPSGGRSPILVRANALLLGTGSLLLVYRLALGMFESRLVAARALLVAMCLPMLATVGVIVLPYGPLVFFHLLALNLLAFALRGDRWRSRFWYLGGVAFGLALLSKLMALLAVVAFLLFLARSPSHRFWWRRKELYIALCLTLLVFSPFLYWNLANNWAGLRLQIWDRHQETFRVSLGRLGEFLFEQLANTSLFLGLPVVGSLFVSSARLPRAWEAPFRLIRCQSLTILGFFLIVAAVAETHPHWTMLAYPPAAIALAVVWTSVPRHLVVRGLRWWIGLSFGTLIVAVCLGLVGALLVSQAALKDLGGSPGRALAQAQVELFGWSDVRLQLDRYMQHIATGRRAVLFADGYAQASQLYFHHPGEPVINVAAYVDKGKRLGDAQWYYLPVERLAGESGVFVSDLSGPTINDLRFLFQRAEQVGIVEQRNGREALRQYRVFQVDGFKGDAIGRVPATSTK